MDKTTLAGRTILSAMLLSLGSSQIVWALDASGDTSIPPILSWDYYNESYYGKAFVNNIILGSQSYNTINGSNNIILNSGGRSHNAFNTVNGNSVNIGSNIYTGNTSTGIGDAVFAGDCSVAIGDDIYNHNDSQGIGYYTKDNIRPTGDHSVALGSSIEANGYASIALGRSVKANGHDSIAIGTMSASLGEGSVAIGSKSYASMEEYVVSFGHKIGENATTFGINVSQDSDLDANGKYKNTLTRRLINITDGIDNSDAATKGQVISRATFSDNILTLARNNGKDNITVDLSELVTDDSLNVKYTDNTKSAVDIGNASFSTTGVGSFGSVSVGGNTYIDSNGINANSKVISNVAAAVKDTDAVNKKQMEDADSKVLKDSKEYTDVKVTDLEAKDALNVKYTDNTKSAVDIGNASFSTTGVGSFGSVSVGGNTYIDSNGINANNKVISNVAGPVKDTDAANKSYVDVSAADTLQNAKDYTDGKVADLAASDSLSVKYTDNTKSAVDIGSASISTTGRGNFGSISVGGNTYIDDKGIDANSKVISNVAAAVKDSDAVNKKQMEAADDKILETSKVYTDTKIKNVTVDALREANDYTDMRFNNLDQKINKTGAATAAMAGLHPLEFDEEQKLNFAVATGGYHGSSAIALGMFYRPNEHVMFNLSGSTSGSEHMYSLGASFALDRPSGTHVSSRRALTEKVQQLSQVNEAVIEQSMELQAKNDELQSQIAELRQIVMEMKKSA